MRWNRSLWGVEFFAGDGKKRLLLGAGWGGMTRASYAGEPTHALLFTSRAAARAWCVMKQAGYAGRADFCAQWWFRPVRVRETVRVVK